MGGPDWRCMRDLCDKFPPPWLPDVFLRPPPFDRSLHEGPWAFGCVAARPLAPLRPLCSSPTASLFSAADRRGAIITGMATRND